ncbi:unnamed protein product [Closterium sp. Naga37s-1]|nr:unnamed protein product [Closterium sp. Naga37s-1]
MGDRRADVAGVIDPDVVLLGDVMAAVARLTWILTSSLWRVSWFPFVLDNLPLEIQPANHKPPAGVDEAEVRKFLRQHAELDSGGPIGFVMWSQRQFREASSAASIAAQQTAAARVAGAGGIRGGGEGGEVGEVGEGGEGGEGEGEAAGNVAAFNRNGLRVSLFSEPMPPFLYGRGPQGWQWVLRQLAWASQRGDSTSGGGKGRQGGDKGRQGGDKGRQGGDKGRQGGDKGRQGGDKGRQGGDKGRQGGDKGRQGGDKGRERTRRKGEAEEGGQGVEGRGSGGLGGGTGGAKRRRTVGGRGCGGYEKGRWRRGNRGGGKDRMGVGVDRGEPTVAHLRWHVAMCHGPGGGEMTRYGPARRRAPLSHASHPTRHLPLRARSCLLQQGFSAPAPLNGVWLLNPPLCLHPPLTGEHPCLMRRIRPGICPCELAHASRRSSLPSSPFRAGPYFACSPEPPPPPPRPVLAISMPNTSLLARAKTIMPNLLVAALDPTAYRIALLHGLPVFYDNTTAAVFPSDAQGANGAEGAEGLGPVGCAFNSHCFRHYTKLKSRAVLRVLRLGYAVLWSDVDVAWFENPLPMLWQYGEGVLAIQSNEPDPSLPANSIRRINSGFYLARPDPLTIAALTAVVKHAAHSRLSEQPSFYDVLCGEHGERRVSECVACASLTAASTLVSEVGSDTCQWTNGLRVVFLPRQQFPNGAVYQLWGPREGDAGSVQGEVLSGADGRGEVVSAGSATNNAAAVAAAPPPLLHVCLCGAGRGHGTREGEEGQVCATVCGVVKRINRLLSVQPLKTWCVVDCGGDGFCCVGSDGMSVCTYMPFVVKRINRLLSVQPLKMCEAHQPPALRATTQDVVCDGNVMTCRVLHGYVAQTGDVVVGRVTELVLKRPALHLLNTTLSPPPPSPPPFPSSCPRPSLHTDCRYVAQTGDVVVGRVTELAPKRWKLAVGSAHEAQLMLSAINLPGGAQRRRTAVDELNMRNIYVEGDLVTAEVQSVFHDGSVVLHTRSDKYGKLSGGLLVHVPPYLVRRLKQHFHMLSPSGPLLVFGCNGWLWVGQPPPSTSSSGSPGTQGEGASGGVGGGAGGKRAAETAVRVEERERICRVAAAIRALERGGLAVDPPALARVVEWSVAMGVSVAEMGDEDFVATVVEKEVEKREADAAEGS